MAISIGRLSGGNTPADGSDPRTFPAIWNATADTLEAGVIPTSLTSPTTGQLLQYNGTNWVNVGQAEAGAIPVFADSSARSSAIPSPSEGMVTYVEDANRVEVYDGASFGPIGGILQVVSTTKTDTFSASAARDVAVDVTGLSATITPSSVSSKILVLISIHGSMEGGGSARGAIKALIDRNGSNIGNADGDSAAGHVFINNISGSDILHLSVNYLDSPATTSSLIYKVQAEQTITSGSGSIYINRDGNNNNTATSSITLMEVAV